VVHYMRRRGRYSGVASISRPRNGFFILGSLAKQMGSRSLVPREADFRFPRSVRGSCIAELWPGFASEYG